MQMMMQELMQMQQQFQQETVAEMTEKFQALMQDMLYLSSQEEQLRSEVKSASRNSPRLREMAARQQVLQDQLQSIMNQMMDLSKETFAITPEIGRSVGKANAGMQEAKNKLTDRNVSQAGENQNMAMEGLNEAALGLFNSMQSMQQSGSASGYSQFLKMMQQMAGQQQGLNQQGMQLSMGQMAAAAQQQMMQQMLQKQQGLRKSLEQMMNEMRHSGQKGMGDLGGIGKEMDEVIKDLQRRRFTRKTKERQQRILSRMLDSQTSMTQRGFKDERKSTSAESTVSFEGPGGLPADMGQRQSLALQALNKAINAGYSREHQTMIKRYFNSLSQLQTEQKSMETDDEK
jgi:predicted nuclease with TOPRIM domain